MATQPIVKNLNWTSEHDTQACAQRLAQAPLVANATIELHGDLGAGKTTWVRHLLRALGVSGRIKSPTYGVVEPHQGLCAGQPLEIWHFDFYRLQDPQEWIEAGLRDHFTQEGLKLVEWPEQAGEQRPPADLALHIDSVDEDSREVRALAYTELGRHLLEVL